MVVEFPSSQTRLTRAQHAALASLLSRSNLFAKPEPRSTDEEEALALLMWLGRTTGRHFFMIEREGSLWTAVGAWQQRLEWLGEHGAQHSIEDVLARCTVLIKRNPLLLVFADQHVELWSVPKPERAGPMRFRASAQPAEAAQLARVK